MASTREQVVEVRKGMFQTRVLIKGDGPPVVFLHGISGLKWDPFLDDLATRFTVYAPMFPGSDCSADIDHLDNLWDVVLYKYELLDQLGLRSPAVVGHNFGGMVAAEMAATNPERVSRLVLIAPYGLWRDDYPTTDPVANFPDTLNRATFYDPEGPVAQEILAQPTDPEEASAAFVRWNAAMGSATKFLWPIPDKGLKKRLHRIQAPTLLVWGKQDGMVPPVYANEFASRIADARIKLIDQAGHLPHREQREQVSALILDFLA